MNRSRAVHNPRYQIFSLTPNRKKVIDFSKFPKILLFFFFLWGSEILDVSRDHMIITSELLQGMPGGVKGVQLMRLQIRYARHGTLAPEDALA